MPINMSYCRFQNTLIALRECKDAIAEADANLFEGLSEEEHKAAIKLIRLCALLADSYFEEVQFLERKK